MRQITEPTIEFERAKRRRRVIALALILFFALIAAFTARPAYHRLKAWRARHLVAEGERLMTAERWEAAALKAKSAYLLWPHEPRAIRLAARIQTRARLSSALQFWQLLIATDAATPEDRREYVELALRLGALTQAHAELTRLSAEDPQHPANLRLLSHLCLAQGDLAAATRFAVAAQTQSPTNTVYQLHVASLRFDAPEKELQAAAQQTLWSFARETNSFGLQALEFLATRRELAPEQARQAIDLLETHPLKKVGQRLLALTLRLRVQPGDRAQLLDAAARDFAGSPPADRQQFAVWLNQQREFERTLRAIPLADARQRGDFFIVHLDALASLGRWQEIETILTSRDVPLPPVHLDAFKARCALKLDKPAAATAAWSRALLAAERQPEELTWLADYAEKNGAFDQARRAYRALIGCLRDPRPAYKALAEAIERRGPTGELRDLLREMLKRWPYDPALRNDCAYLNLLLGDELEPSRRAAEELVTANPASLPQRTTLALAYYRSRDFTGALELYQGRDFDWSLALPANRAVYAAVLAANGSFDQARQILRALPTQALRKEELTLIKPLL